MDKDDLKNAGETVIQEVCQRTITSIAKNPQTAITTGVAAAKTIGGAVVAAAPYVIAVAAGVTIGWGLVKLISGRDGSDGRGGAAPVAVLRC